ncbi:MAG: hypothetical protein VX346_12835 [Planctomycetota bacterium]|nr:hypothetical protein [Planctomycetota bacterium]
MLDRYLGTDEQAAPLWNELGRSAPTLYALARLCSQRWSLTAPPEDPLSLEAQAILVLAAKRGMFELKVTNTSANAVERLLTVFVEVSENELIPVRIPGDLQTSLRLFDGFRELCATSLVMHHQLNEFSLTTAGFAAAVDIANEEVDKLLAQIQASVPKN